MGATSYIQNNLNYLDPSMQSVGCHGWPSVGEEKLMDYQDPSMKIASWMAIGRGKKANAYKYPLTFLK